MLATLVERTVQGAGNRQGATGIGQRGESAVLARIAWKRPSTYAFRRSRPESAVGCGHRYDTAQPPLRPRGPIDQRASEDDTSNSHNCFGPLGAKYREGAAVTVFYNPQNPSHHDIKEPLARSGNLTTGKIAFFLIILGVIALAGAAVT